jgi:exonuclease III
MSELNSREILKEYGGSNLNDLSEILGSHEDNDVDCLYNHIKSNYYDLDGMCKFLENKKDKLSILSVNIQSINAKIDKLKIMLDSLDNNKLGLICIQESWLSDLSDTSLLNIQKYNLIHQGHSCSKHGGLAIYVNKDIQSNNIQNYNTFSTWEGLAIDIPYNDKNKKHLTVLNVYRPPKLNNNNASLDHFMEEFCPIITQLKHKCKDLIIIGDFNIDLLKLQSRAKYQDFFDFMTSQGLIQNITLPTRFASKSASLIDHLYTNYSENIHQASGEILYSTVSDHFGIFACLNLNIPPKKVPKYVKSNDFSKLASANFITDLSNIKWENCFDHDINTDPNLGYNHFTDILINLRTKHFPDKTTKFNKYKHKLNKWITNGILRSLKFKDKLYKKLKCTPLNSRLYNTLKSNLKTYTSILNKIIRNAKKDYYFKVFHKYSADSKKTWETINELLSRNSTKNDLPEYFMVNGKQITKLIEIANKFNEFFVNIGPKLSSSINIDGKKNYSSYLTKHISSHFKFKSITEQETLKIITGLKPKSSTGHDEISMKLVKQWAHYIIAPLTALINQSLNLGIFPERLKTAKVLPIYKKEENYIFDNYRPISLLPSLSKIFEKVAHIQLLSYLDLNKLIYAYQYGFRPKHSTE